MADRFARAGIACLLYGRRGTVKSIGNGQWDGFEASADDALAGVEHLRHQPEIARDQIGLWGTGEAGWVIPVAANKSDHVAFCVAVSGGGVPPSTQELWRRAQYLQFLGCDARLQEFARRGTAMYLQWGGLYQAGQFPIRPLFGAEPRSLDFDAATAIRRIHQPVLAIFGETDVETPPRASAAIWAQELAAGGNRDHAVRLFSHATHGMLRSDRPFEVLPESRLAPGYLKSTIQWIASHTHRAAEATGTTGAAVPLPAGGNPPEFEGAAVDVASSARDSAQSRAMGALPWYGSAPVQVSSLFVALLGSLWTLAFWPSAWAVRKFRRMPRRGPPKRRTVVIGSVTHVGALVLSGVLWALMHTLGQASPDSHFRAIEVALWGIAALVIPIAAVAAFLVRSSVQAIGRTGRTPMESASAWISAAAVGLWAFFLTCWTWIPLCAG
jgi:dienelactone hydrolase